MGVMIGRNSERARLWHGGVGRGSVVERVAFSLMKSHSGEPKSRDRRLGHRYHRLSFFFFCMCALKTKRNCVRRDVDAFNIFSSGFFSFRFCFRPRIFPFLSVPPEIIYVCGQLGEKTSQTTALCILYIPLRDT